MKIHIAIVTLGDQDNINRLFSPKFWLSIGRNVVENIFVFSQLRPVTISPWAGAKLLMVYSETNLGCAGARAEIVRYFMADDLKPDDIIIFLDDDVEVVGDYWLADLCAPLLRHYSISGVAGRRVTEDYQTEATNELHPDYVSGGWCAIRGDVFLDGCMFDEQFFPNYWEDVDLCFQARAKGKQIIAVGNIGLKHVHPPSSEAAHHVWENRDRFIEKWSKK